MKAVVVTPKQKRSARIEEVPIPELMSGKVFVKVFEVGIDGTDREINEGLYGDPPEGASYLTLGHESLGRVEKVTQGVKDFQEGDWVVATVRRPCPENCPNCRIGDYDMCTTGHYRERGIKGLHGYMSEYYVEDPQFLIKIPKSLKPFTVLLEPLSIVEKAISQSFEIQKRLVWEPQNALVLGAGPVGLLATMILRLRGLRTFTLDRAPEESLKAKMVKTTGAVYLKNEEPSILKLPERIGKIDLIIEATGYSPFAFQAMCILGINGVLALTGVSGGERKIQIPSDAVNLGIVLGNRLVFGSVNSNADHFNQGLKHIREFELKWPGLFSSLITRRLPFTRFKEGLEKQPGEMKTLLEFAHE